jgi:3-hydroxybutyryl-CoA dehydrogenase
MFFMKTLSSIKTIAVAGAGTMGAGIAQVSAAAGFDTLLFDITESVVSKGMQIIEKNLSIGVEKKKITPEEKLKILSKIKTAFHLEQLKADIIVEAIIEKIEIKQKLFQNLADINSDDCIFATNTSSIPISDMASGIAYPERVCGMHFFNPAHIMQLVEIVSGNNTSTQVADTVFQLAKKFGKEPIHAKDYPGFIVNRIGKLYHTEPLKILEDKVADVQTIDRLMEASGFKMGPFKLIDLIGVDANLNVTKSLYELTNHDPKFKPSATQQKLVDEGKLGKKSGEGFYRY